jgi:hypothetical protein
MNVNSALAPKWTSTFGQYGLASILKRRANQSTIGVSAAQIVVNVT